MNKLARFNEKDIAIFHLMEGLDPLETKKLYRDSEVAKYKFIQRLKKLDGPRKKRDALKRKGLRYCQNIHTNEIEKIKDGQK